MLVTLPARFPTSPRRMAPSARSRVAAETERIMAGAPSARMRRYAAACGRISALAPSIPSSGAQPRFKTTANTAPTRMAHQPHRLDTVRTSCLSPAPNEEAAAAQPPMPSTVAPAEASVNTGLTTETAAVWAVSCKRLMKNRSVML